VSAEAASYRDAEAASYREGMRAVLTIAATVWFFGASFGLFARSAGLGIVAPLVMSATTFAGSAQFAAASILGSGGGAIAAVAAAVLLNARYLPISISVASLFHGPRLRRLAEAQLIVDESWAISSRGGGRFDRGLLVGAGLILYAAWVTGTAVGVAGGQALGSPKDLGLDGAFPALFLALLVPQLVGVRERAAALLGAALALALIPFTPAGTPIVAASAACLLGLRYTHRWGRRT
jgi:4-azaleucine resistance transporter AzlC